MREVKIVCHDCLGYNKHQRGNDGFEEKQTNFTSFSDAWNHMFENRNHWMNIEVIDYEDEE